MKYNEVAEQMRGKNKMAHAQIHHYDYDIKETNPHVDDYGEELLGYYYQLFDDNNKPLTNLMGPYSTKDEVEAASKADWMVR